MKKIRNLAAGITAILVIAAGAANASNYHAYVNTNGRGTSIIFVLTSGAPR